MGGGIKSLHPQAGQIGLPAVRLEKEALQGRAWSHSGSFLTSTREGATEDHLGPMGREAYRRTQRRDSLVPRGLWEEPSGPHLSLGTAELAEPAVPTWPL